MVENNFVLNLQLKVESKVAISVGVWVVLTHGYKIILININLIKRVRFVVLSKIIISKDSYYVDV